MGDTHEDFTRISQNEGMPDEISISLPNAIAGQVADFKTDFIRSQPGVFEKSSWMLNESVNSLTVFSTIAGHDKRAYPVETVFTPEGVKVSVYTGSGNDRVICAAQKVATNESVWEALVKCMDFSDVPEQV